MKIVFMGTPEFAVPVLEGLISSGYSLVGVYTRPDKGKGRGQELAISAVKMAALVQKLPVYQPASFKVPGEVQNLRALNPDLIAVAAYILILPREVLTLPQHGCLNVHPSLLPKYRGPSPVAAAILAGEPATGVTIMLMSEGMDAGPVLAQKEEAILPEDTTGSLTERLARLGAQMLVETIPGWVEGKITPVLQDESKATYSRILKKEDGEIDWSNSAGYIVKQIRAFQPWPGCYTFWKGKRLTVRQASSPLGVDMRGRDTGPPGKVISVTTEKGNLPGVVTGDGLMVLHRLQLEGKREMSAAEFVRGQRDFIGSVLVASIPKR